MKKIYVILISIIIILSTVGIIWLYKSPGGDSNKLNADDFFTEIWTTSLEYEQNDTWTLYDKVEKTYSYYIPELDSYNETGNLDIMNEYTAIKFETSEQVLVVEGNQTQNFTLGKYATHVEKVKYYENEELSEWWGWDHSIGSGYLPLHIYNKWVKVAFQQMRRANDSPPFTYSSEILNETTIKITITNVLEYYPNPIKWNQVHCKFIEFKGIGAFENITIGENPQMIKDENISFSNNPELLSLFNITAFQNDEMIYNFFYPYEASGNAYVKEGQYLLINWDTTKWIQMELTSINIEDEYFGTINIVP